MICDLVKTVAADGLRLDGVVLAPTVEAASVVRLDAVICLHGVGSNFYGSTLLEGLSPTLQSLGMHVIWANTRGHDNLFAGNTRQGRRWLGAAYESVDECRLDVTAWLDLCRHRGWSRVLLLGHSLGAIKSVYSQAHSPASEVASIVAISPPRLSYVFFKNDPEGMAFFEAIRTAERYVANGEPDHLIHVRYPFPLWISAGGYVEKYGPAERYNIVRFADQLPCPTLFVYGQLELDSGSVSFAGVPEALRSAARASQILDVAVVPSADHNYTRVTAPLALAIREWLQRQFGC